MGGFTGKEEGRSQDGRIYSKSSHLGSSPVVEVFRSTPKRVLMTQDLGSLSV